MTTPDAVPQSETFLRRFHDRTPGELAKYHSSNPVSGGRTSLQVLAERVAGAQRVLDLGCGDGALLTVLAHNGASELAGVDLSEGELALARVRPELADADLRVGRAQELPFADESFDAVVSHMALMLMSDIEQVIAEIARVSMPKGRLALVIGARPAPRSGFDLFLSLALPILATLPPERRVPPLGDRRTRHRTGLDELLVPAGFEPVTWEQITLEMSGTPEQVWESAVQNYYDVAMLDGDQLAQLHEKFIAEALALSEYGQLTGGARISVAMTQLRGY